MLYDDKKLDNLKQYSGTWPTQLDAKALGRFSLSPTKQTYLFVAHFVSLQLGPWHAA